MMVDRGCPGRMERGVLEPLVRSRSEGSRGLHSVNAEGLLPRKRNVPRGRNLNNGPRNSPYLPNDHSRANQPVGQRGTPVLASVLLEAQARDLHAFLRADESCRIRGCSRGAHRAFADRDRFERLRRRLCRCHARSGLPRLSVRPVLPRCSGRSSTGLPAASADSLPKGRRSRESPPRSDGKRGVPCPRHRGRWFPLPSRRGGGNG
jgi:hypothetical protein